MPSGPELLIKAAILEVSPFTTSEELVTVTVMASVCASWSAVEGGNIPWAASTISASLPDIDDKSPIIPKANMAPIIPKRDDLLFIGLPSESNNTFCNRPIFSPLFRCDQLMFSIIKLHNKKRK
jgi:hypothetical protein